MKLLLVFATLALGCTVDDRYPNPEPPPIDGGTFPNCYQEPTGPDTGTGPFPQFPLCPGSPPYRTGDCDVYQGSLRECTACKFWLSGKNCLTGTIPDAGM